jgi:hypothetical protein
VDNFLINKIMGIIKFALKSGICIYAVKYTVDEGAWSSSEDALKFKENCCKAVNENEYYQTGKSHFLTYVPVPEVSNCFIRYIYMTFKHYVITDNE